MKPGNRLLLCGGTLLLAATTAPPSHADEQSDALLKQVTATTQAVKTLSADLQLSQTAKAGDGKETVQMFQGTVTLKKPNLARIKLSMGGKDSQVIASNGKTLYTTFGNQYMKSTPGANGQNIQAMWAFQVQMFFNPGTKFLGASTTKYLGKETVEGTEYQVIELTSKQMEGETVKLYVAPDNLVTRIALAADSGGQTIKVGAALKNIKRNISVDDVAFAYTPPKTATLYKQPDYAANLIAVGKQAPKFDLLRPEGGKISLENTIKDKKAVLVNFWFYG